MKSYQRFFLPPLGFLFIVCFLMCSSCEPKEEQLVYKPNIYIYPEENINLEVYLDFPQGGRVVASIPEYGNNWDVFIDTTGTIDNSYQYLFYESAQPDEWQRYEGWLVEQKGLESFFENNLLQYGFRGIEIDDFIEYWIPRLKSFEYYLIYPQTQDEIDPLIDLSFSITPDNIQRLFYFIHGENELPKNQIHEPTIDNIFEREGFFVVEWGVII
jgi:hypothetical protein